MYLARHHTGGQTRYTIRESYSDGECLTSRDLVDLGNNPGEYIVYPGGNAFYIHEEVYERLLDRDTDPDEESLERIFWPFIRPEIRQVIESFSRGSRSAGRHESIREQGRRCEATRFHLFDQRRMHYLRFGELDQSRIWRVPKKIYRKLLDKSRDEIEQLFMEMERIIRPAERKTYAYVIFNVPGHFQSELSRKFPQALPQDKVDECFLDEICRLNADGRFWKGLGFADRLHDYLVRYVCWFFDYDYPDTRPMAQWVRQWMDQRRKFRPPPPKPAMAVEEALSVMDVTPKALSRMTVKCLTRQYRRMAKNCHPDRGGNHDRFIKLNQAYADLLRRIRARTGRNVRYTTRRA